MKKTILSLIIAFTASISAQAQQDIKTLEQLFEYFSEVDKARYYDFDTPVIYTLCPNISEDVKIDRLEILSLNECSKSDREYLYTLQNDLLKDYKLMAKMKDNHDFVLIVEKQDPQSVNEFVFYDKDRGLLIRVSSHLEGETLIQYLEDFKAARNRVVRFEPPVISEDYDEEDEE